MDRNISDDSGTGFRTKRETVWWRLPWSAWKTPRQLAWYITDKEGYYISESIVYRILKAFDLIPSPAYTVIAAADRFVSPTSRVHQMWQTDFTYFKIVGWGWYCMSSKSSGQIAV